MDGFDKNKKPDQETIDFIEGFMSFSSNMFAMPVAMPSHHDLISNTAAKMAKDIGRLEDLSSERKIEKEIQYYKELLINWIANGWIKDPSKMNIDGYFNNPDNACPSCGWKNTSSNRVTTCFNCQTGMITVDGKWYKVNEYIDPENFYIPALYKRKTYEIDNIKEKQKKFFKNPKSITFPLGYHDFVQDWKKFSLKCQYQKQWDPGLIAIVEAVNLDPLNSALWRDLITFGLSSGFIDISFIASKLIMNMYPDDYSTKSNFKRIFEGKDIKIKLFQQGMVISQHNEYEKGLSCFWSGLKLNYKSDFDRFLMYGMGWAYFHLDKFKLAQPYFEKALKSKYTHPVYPKILFSCYFKLGQIKLVNSEFKEGLKYLKKALLANPNDVVIEQWIYLTEKGMKNPNHFKIKAVDGKFDITMKNSK